MIRKAIKKDIKEVIQILNNEFNINDMKYMKKVLDFNNLYVLIEKEELISFGFYKLINDNHNNTLSNIYLLYTKEEFRNLGYIRKLINQFNKFDVKNGVKSSLILPSDNKLALIFAKLGYVNITYRETIKYEYSKLGKLELVETLNYKLIDKLYNNRYFKYYILRDKSLFKYVLKKNIYKFYLIKFNEKVLGYLIYDEINNLVKEICTEDRIKNIALDNLCTKFSVPYVNYYEYHSGNQVYVLRKDYHLNSRDYYINKLI